MLFTNNSYITTQTVNGKSIKINNSNVEISNLQFNPSNSTTYQYETDFSVNGSIYINNSSVNVENLIIDNLSVVNLQFSNWKGLGIYIDGSSGVQVNNSFFK